MDAKQYATKQPTDHRSSQRGNKKKKNHLETNEHKTR